MRKLRTVRAWMARVPQDTATHMTNGQLTTLGVALIGYGGVLIAFHATMATALGAIVHTVVTAL